MIGASFCDHERFGYGAISCMTKMMQKEERRGAFPPPSTSPSRVLRVGEAGMSTKIRKAKGKVVVNLIRIDPRANAPPQIPESSMRNAALSWKNADFLGFFSLVQRSFRDHAF